MHLQTNCCNIGLQYCSICNIKIINKFQTKVNMLSTSTVDII